MISPSIVSLLALSTLGLALPVADPGQDYGKGGCWKDCWKERIKNVVVLVEENRSFDTFAGGLTYNPSIDGLLDRNYCQPANVTAQGSHTVCAQPIALDVAPDDPNHSISGVNMQLFSTCHPDVTSPETMLGFATEQGATYNSSNITRISEAINYYTEDHVRVFAAMAENFVLNPTAPISLPAPRTATAITMNPSSPQLTLNAPPSSSCFLPDSLFYSWTVSSGANLTNIKPLSQFYSDAAAGTLPQFTYLNPECCDYYSFHPPSPVSLGESFIKGAYEALRASPQWDSTLLVLTFDEHGGFADHVPPPENVPAGDSLTYTEKAPDGKNISFDFTRLGIRVPTLVISPWVGQGVVENKGSNQGGEYSHTGILAFLAKL